MHDTDVPRAWRELGLPGIVDVHVHFMPHSVLRKVWAYFDDAARHYGVEWPITYRTDDESRVDLLAALGVRAFTALVYPHRPGMGEWLNGWALDFAARTPGCVPTFTMHPEQSAGDYVRRAIDAGGRVCKLHLQVGAYDPRDPLLERAWGQLEDAGTVVVTHCASGPVPGPFTGPGPIGEVLARHPRLRLVVAHLGMPEYGGFFDLAEAYEHVALDTTMAFTDFSERRAPFPAELRPRLLDLGLAGKVLFGSDFPNIPYSYGHAVESLVRLELGDAWLRAVLHDSAATLLLA